MWRLAPLFFLALGVQTSPECRCFPGDSCWPSTRQWTDFNSTLGGKLITTVPLSSVCHSSGEFAAYDARACDSLIANWSYPATHYVTPVSPMASWFANFSCDPFVSRNTPCDIGALQRFSVNVTSVEDVRKTLEFTKEHNIRIVIRNTGHDYSGKSTAPGAVALWVHHIKDIHHLHYTSPGYNGSALRLGAGVQGFEAMAAARAHNEIVVVGNCESIGVAGGYTQGGGHSQLMSHFGLAADQVLEWEVVMADGKHLTASPTQNRDLFWALNGGGGGTFAVVISATVKTRPEMITSAATLIVNGTGVASRVFNDVLRTFILGILPLVDAGAVAVWTVIGTQFTVTPIALPGGHVDQLRNGLASTLALLEKHNINHSKSRPQASGGLLQVQITIECTEYNIKEFSTFYDSYAAMNPKANITEAQLGGRLLPRSAIESNTTALVSTFQKLIAQGVAVSGISMNISRMVAPLTSANPAWRDTAVSLVIGTYVNSVRGEAQKTDRSQTVQLHKPRTRPQGPVIDDGVLNAEHCCA